MSGVHLSLEALARGWLAASVVSCRRVMVTVENRFCGNSEQDLISGGKDGSPTPPSVSSPSCPFPVCFPPLLSYL